MLADMRSVRETVAARGRTLAADRSHGHPAERVVLDPANRIDRLHLRVGAHRRRSVLRGPPLVLQVVDERLPLGVQGRQRAVQTLRQPPGPPRPASRADAGSTRFGGCQEEAAAFAIYDLRLF